jgi:hypothetical protein
MRFSAVLSSTTTQSAFSVNRFNVSSELYGCYHRPPPHHSFLSHVSDSLSVALPRPAAPRIAQSAPCVGPGAWRLSSRVALHALSGGLSTARVSSPAQLSLSLSLSHTRGVGAEEGTRTCTTTSDVSF